MRRAVMTAAAVVAVGVGGQALAAKLSRCVDEKGRTTFTEVCPVAPPAPEPSRSPPPCQLSPEELRRASRLETQFLNRYPDAASHRAAAVADLKDVVVRLRSAGNHLGDLQRERKSIDDELEFYCRKPVPSSLARGSEAACFKPVPVELGRRLDASEAKFAAMADVYRAIDNDVATLVAKYQCEHTQFEAIWGGGAAGSSACVPACKAGG